MHVILSWTFGPMTGAIPTPPPSGISLRTNIQLGNLPSLNLTSRKTVFPSSSRTEQVSITAKKSCGLLNEVSVARNAPKLCNEVSKT